MSVIDSALDPEALAQARALLAPPAKRERLGPVLGAAAFAAIAALALAAAMITAPPVVTQHVLPPQAEDGPAAGEASLANIPLSEAPLTESILPPES